MKEKNEYSYDWEKNNRGHEWRLDEDGHVDIFGIDSEYHNGPICVKCGYGFCQHCDDGPTKDCVG